MNIENLFPTTSTFTQGLQNQYTGELAENFGAGTPVVNSLNSYWLGYISRDNLPLQYTMGAVYVDTDEGVLVCKDVTDKANFPCTYVRHGYQSGQNQYSRVRLSKSVNGGTPEITYASVRPFNQLYPEYAGMDYNSITGFKYTLGIDGRAMVFDGGGNLLTVNYNNDPDGQFGIYFYFDSTSVSPAYGNRMVKAAYDFLFKNAEIEIKIYVSSLGDYITFKCRASDFNDGGTAFLDNGTYTARLFLTQFSMYSFIRIYQNGYIDVLPLGFAVKTSNHYGDNHYEYEISSLGSFFYPLVYSEIRNVTSERPGLYFGCGFDDTFPISEITRIESYTASSTGYPYGYTDNLLFSKSYPSVAIYPLVTIDQIRKTFSLSFRVDISGSHMPGYVEGFTYATDVTADNEFLAKLKTGDIEDPNYKNSLRPWQYENFQEDDFTEEDVPPYEPPEPGGDDDPGSDEPVETPTITGDDQELQIDRTLPAPTDFITLYVITPPILSRFGRTLWTSLADYNPQDPTSVEIYKNFFAILNEQVTGTLDISSVLNYVISVRQYPFDVSDLPTVTQAGNSITFGTGKLPIDCGSAAVVCTMSSTIGILDCGEVTIADYKDFKLYNDFRDYHNTTVTAFLPYCGTVELNPMETIHNTIHCYYAIDFYTGECTAYLTVTDEKGHKIIAGIKNGIIGVLLPITATNSGQLSGRHTVDNAMDSSLVTGFFGSAFGAVANLATGNVSGMANNIVNIANQQMVTRQILQGEREGRSAVMSPSLSGGTGAAAFYQPAGASILVRRGTYARDKIKNYPQTCGYPATSSGTLSSFQGYTECYNVDVSGINCTDEEKSAIKALLESGVYL